MLIDDAFNDGSTRTAFLTTLSPASCRDKETIEILEFTSKLKVLEINHQKNQTLI
jgi:hypothetical protein